MYAGFKHLSNQYSYGSHWVIYLMVSLSFEKRPPFCNIPKWYRPSFPTKITIRSALAFFFGEYQSTSTFSWCTHQCPIITTTDIAGWTIKTNQRRIANVWTFCVKESLMFCLVNWFYNFNLIFRFPSSISFPE